MSFSYSFKDLILLKVKVFDTKLGGPFHLHIRCEVFFNLTWSVVRWKVYREINYFQLLLLKLFIDHGNFRSLAFFSSFDCLWKNLFHDLKVDLELCFILGYFRLIFVLATNWNNIWSQIFLVSLFLALNEIHLVHNILKPCCHFSYLYHHIGLNLSDLVALPSGYKASSASHLTSRFMDSHCSFGFFFTCNMGLRTEETLDLVGFKVLVRDLEVLGSV
jgi:hypothetical protein